MKNLSELIEVERDKAWDDEVAGYCRLAGRIINRLVVKGWEQQSDAGDGLGCWDQKTYGYRLIHSIARELDGDVWAHVSMSRRDGVMPTWRQVRDVWWLCYPDVIAVVVVAPESKHINLAEVAHVWGNLSRPAVPDFTHGLGTI